MTKPCSIEECPNEILARGLCTVHYSRQRRTGTTDGPIIKSSRTPRMSLEERFWAKVEKTDGCWNWTAAKVHNGYGVFTLPDQQQVAHKVAYRWSVGEVPEGFDLDHMCHNRECVNPAHLRLATHKQNQENRAGAQRNSKSGVLGVHYDARTKMWTAKVKHHGKVAFNARYSTLQDAADAARNARQNIFTHNDLDRVA